MLRKLNRIIVTVRNPLHKRELTPEEMAEQLQWALRHEKWSVATWAKGAWTSAAVLRMRYHAEALKWKAINIDIWGCVFWREFGPLVVD